MVKHKSFKVLHKGKTPTRKRNLLFMFTKDIFKTKLHFMHNEFLLLVVPLEYLYVVALMISRSYEDSLAVTNFALDSRSESHLHEIFTQNPVCHLRIFCICIIFCPGKNLYIFLWIFLLTDF